MRVHLAGTFAIVLAAAQVLLAQQTPPTFRAGVEAVAVDAFVTDRAGNPVTNLTIDDFELLEDGKPQRITSFTEVNIPIRPPESYSPTAVEPDVATNSAGEGRLYVIALDEVHPEYALKARRFLRTFIEQHFEANDIGIVVSIGRARSADMQDFTGNRRLLLAAVDKFTGGFPGWDDNERAPLTQTSNPRDQASALRALMESLAAIQGRRKAVLYVTQQVGQSAMDTAARGRANVWDVIDYRGGVKSIEFDDLRAAMTAAMRGGISFYTIDPEGLCALDCPEGAENLERMDSLRKLAAATGGFAVVSSNLFTDAFPRIVAENSNYYVLGFTSSSAKRDGRYRQLQVRARRPGLTVRSRDGYIAPSKSSQPSEPKARTGVTLAAGVGESIATPLASGTVPMSVFSGVYRGSGKNTNVVIAVNMDATRLDLVDGSAGTGGQIEVAAVAVSAAGKVAGSQRERFTLALKPESWAKAKETGIRVVTGMTLPPGRYQLRLAAGNVAATKAGSVMYDLEVPDFSKPPLAMSALTLTSRLTSSILTVASTTIRPVVPAPPTSTREFSAGDTLSVYAEVYDNRPKAMHRLDFVAELRGPDGTRTGSAVTDTRPNGEAVHKLEAALPLNVPPGAYVLHVEARSTLEKQLPVSRDVPIRVR
jgi:VWFA-related protein